MESMEAAVASSLRVEPLATGFRVCWSDGGSGEFPFIWLRDNCLCPECRHPEAWERTLDTVELDIDVRPAAVDANGALTLVWEDGHRTEFTETWLRTHAPGTRATATTTPPTPWTGPSIREAFPEIDLSEIEAGDAGLLRWLRLIHEYGFALVRGMPPRVGAVVALAERIGCLQETNFGRTFQVVSKPDPENLAYTAVRLNPHTDVPNRRAVPGLQFLNCIEFEAEGGESILVDGYTAATRLKEQDPEAHALLAAVSVPYRFQDAHHDIGNRFPVIGLDADGAYSEIRFNLAVAEPLDLGPDLIPPYYRALKAFGRILRDPELQLEVKMRPGDCQVFDNRRVLHGRAAFDPNSGPRHLEGCYVDGDDFLSRLRVLERRGNGFRAR